MPEWVRTNDGTPLKTTDAMLEELYVCYMLIARIEADKQALENEIDWYRNRSDQPAHVRL